MRQSLPTSWAPSLLSKKICAAVTVGGERMMVDVSANKKHYSQLAIDNGKRLFEVEYED